MTNWTTLRDEIATFAERDVATDAEFAGAVTRFIANAEKRIFDELPLTIFNEDATGVMAAGNPYIAKPEGMKIVGTLRVNTTGSVFQPMYARTRTYIAEFWPNQSQTLESKPPRYFAPYDETQFIVAPTPARNYGYQWYFQGDKTPLSEASPTNVLTREHYDMLLAACMVEAFRFSHEDTASEMQARYEAQYTELKRVAVANGLALTMSDAQPAVPRSSGA